MRFTPYYGVLSQLAGAKVKAALASGVANTVENVASLTNSNGIKTMATSLDQVASMFGVSEAQIQYKKAAEAKRLRDMAPDIPVERPKPTFKPMNTPFK